MAASSSSAVFAMLCHSYANVTSEAYMDQQQQAIHTMYSVKEDIICYVFFFQLALAKVFVKFSLSSLTIILSKS